MHRRRILAKTALGASKQEAEGAKNVLDSWDRADLKTLAEQRKERAILAGNLLKRKVPDGGRRRKGGKGGKGRFNRRDREEGSSPRQSRGESTGGDEAEQSATKKGSRDGSNKSTSTPGKKKFPRGKSK